MPASTPASTCQGSFLSEFWLRFFAALGLACSRCGRADVVPNWEHLVWHCQGMDGIEDRPPPPMIGERRADAAARLRWMACVREQVRDKREGDE